jgi:superfamily II DNA helicase RecQ
MSTRFESAQLDALLDVDTEKLCTAVCTQFRLKQIRIWQALAMQALLHQKDVMVKAGTSQGKSLVFQSMVFSKPNAIVMVISPLIALMGEQVCQNLTLCY